MERQLGSSAGAEETGGRRQRSGPRSRIVEAIAVLLLGRPMRAAEIAEALGYPTRYISSYLSYWRTRGLFDYENGFWTLTPEGEEYARNIVERELNSRVTQYVALAKKLLDETQPLTAAMNSKRRGAGRGQSGGALRFTVAAKGSSVKKRQGLLPACKQAIMAEMEELSDDERQVMEALLDHYEKWGSTYTYLDHLERDLDADRVWLMSVLRLLQSKGLIYIYTDRRLGVRVGLSRRLRELLSSCSE